MPKKFAPEAHGEMSRTDRRLLNAAVRAALRDARARHSKHYVSSIALLALSAATLVPHAHADNYTVSTEAELQDALADARDHSDPSATITLTADILTSASTPPFNGAGGSKPITIDTSGYTIDRLWFQNANVVVGGTGTVRGVNGTISTPTGGTAARVVVGGTLTNTGLIVGGRGSDEGGASPQGASGVQAETGSNLINDGTIEGGRGGTIDGTNSGVAGMGVSLRASSMTNNGTIRGGSSTGTGGGGSGVTTIGVVTVINTGTIQGGANATASAAPADRVGVAVGGPAAFLASNATIDNSGTIEGAVGARAIGS